MLTLKTPITFDEKEVTELNLDMDALTGNDAVSVEGAIRQQLSAQNEMLVAPLTDSRYLAAIAARAADVPVEMIYALKIGDFTAVCNEVRDFLLKSA